MKDRWKQTFKSYYSSSFGVILWKVERNIVKVEKLFFGMIYWTDSGQGSVPYNHSRWVVRCERSSVVLPDISFGSILRKNGERNLERDGGVIMRKGE